MRARWLAAGALLLVAGGCEDLRQFTGLWSGPISGDPAHQHGFGAQAVLEANVGSVTRSSLDLNLTLPGRAEALRFEPIRHATDDALGDMRLDEEPLRTYLGYVKPPDEEAYLTVVSLFAEDRIDVRLIRGPEEAYGVFTLRRPKRR
jgi:hypothetical protein